MLAEPHDDFGQAAVGGTCCCGFSLRFLCSSRGNGMSFKIRGWPGGHPHLTEDQRLAVRLSETDKSEPAA